MKEEFIKDYFETRDEVLNEIKENNYKWNRFLIYWSKTLDKYSVDNVLNLYSYNPSGNTFLTFDEWNNEKIDRRIKPKSKGIPIIKDNWKIYVFDIKQTYGKDYNIWRYNHLTNLETLSYYQDKYKILNDSNVDIDTNFYITFKNISKEQIINNYVDLEENEVEFIANTMTSLFLSKLNFNISLYNDSFNFSKNLSDEDILKCMQVANKETAIIFEDFKENAIKIEKVQDKLKNLVIDQHKNNDYIPNTDLESILMAIEKESSYDYEYLNSIYNNLFYKYSYINKDKEEKINTLGIDNGKFYVNDKEVSEEEYDEAFARTEEEHFDLVNGLNIDPSEYEEEYEDFEEYEEETKEDTNISLFGNEQLSLFESREEQLANKICDISRV